MKTTKTAAAKAIALSLAALTLAPGLHAAEGVKPKATIVLVHGAFADGSAWDAVIPLLHKAGYQAVAVQNTLTSFEADVATTRRVIQAQKGNVVAVGHSYGGAVISAAASGLPKVKSLVYVAAFGPDKGETIGTQYEMFGKAPLADALIPDSAGFLFIDTAKYHDAFAQDVPRARTRVMAAAQKPIHGSAFGGSIDNPAWKTVPSWYFVAQEDRALLPELQRFIAKRMKAKTAEFKTSHVPFVSNPKAVAEMILEAAAAASK